MLLAQILRLLLPAARVSTGRCGVCRGFALILMPVVGLVAVVPFAAATLPDPPWIVGAYDAGDLDGLIVISFEVVERLPPAACTLLVISAACLLSEVAKFTGAVRLFTPLRYRPPPSSHSALA